MIETKTCKKCGQIYPMTLAYFDFYGESPDGMDELCWHCLAEYQCQATKFDINAPVFCDIRKKRCRDCCEVKPPNFFYFGGEYKRDSKWGMSATLGTCWTCLRSKAEIVLLTHDGTPLPIRYGRRWLFEDPEKGIVRLGQDPDTWEQVILRIPLAKDIRTWRMKAVPDCYSDLMWREALRYWHGKCAVCGRWHEIVAKDHWHPISVPGCPGTVPTNIVPLCHGRGGCNSRKKNKMPHQWLVSEFGEHEARQIERRIEAFFAYMAERFPVEG